MPEKLRPGISLPGPRWKPREERERVEWGCVK